MYINLSLSYDDFIKRYGEEYEDVFYGNQYQDAACLRRTYDSQDGLEWTQEWEFVISSFISGKTYKFNIYHITEGGGSLLEYFIQNGSNVVYERLFSIVHPDIISCRIRYLHARKELMSFLSKYPKDVRYALRKVLDDTFFGHCYSVNKDSYDANNLDIEDDSGFDDAF